MFLRQFHYVAALEKEGHFGRAAERCNVSQPTLSSGIKNLEEELGIPIILRHQKFQGFTEEGLRVVEWSKRLLADRAAMMEEITIMRDTIHGRLRIGAMPMSSPLLPVFCQKFTAQYPQVQIDIQFLGLDRLTRGLTNFEIDVGFTYLDQKPLSRFHTMPLYEDKLSLLLPDNNWLGDSKAVSWKDASELPLGLLSPFMHERQMMDIAFEKSGQTPRPLVESNSIFQLAFHVMSGNIATIVPKNFTRANNAFRGTREKLLINPTVDQKIGMVWAKGTPTQPMAKATVELMKDAIGSDLFESSFSA